ncbi:hypothetical protein GCM10010967_09020 [Dyadobacter beijingensis]|uniref:Uncharacterized protein n=1 Tax=Dyadobacter beijingensis TaxID=365489 RepID=A0ABQ2HEZ4_9BACT|nr:hypothetical protein [Dyadobacter beijingensis]GGM79504.1 hypothetical protein GCM10010967_09020 [Dyadobacter beijingensis]
MKILIVLFGLLAWISCQDEAPDINEQVYETDATWTNMLAADGCSWHFSITSKDSTISLLPDEASKAKIDKELGKNDTYYSFTKVRLKYSLTGAKSTVQCGWGATNTYDEIKVIDIKKQ